VYSSPSDSAPSSLLTCPRTKENSGTIIEAKRHDGAVSFTIPVMEGAGEGAGGAEVFAAPEMKGAEGGAGGAESFSAPNIGAEGGAGKVAAEAFEAPNMKGA